MKTETVIVDASCESEPAALYLSRKRALAMIRQNCCQKNNEDIAGIVRGYSQVIPPHKLFLYHHSLAARTTTMPTVREPNIIFRLRSIPSSAAGVPDFVVNRWASVAGCRTRLASDGELPFPKRQEISRWHEKVL
jgi:hypothetical protein